jgi:hypothetical protein|tara:strand:+ start:44 stop:304 length:261 start_codon:yes stop_codon:yes gene_type:complete
MKYKKYRIVFLDPTGDSGWQSEKDLKEFTPEECVIEAYVYSKDKKIVRTFASFSINKGSKEITFADTNVIPRACIKTIRRIYEKLK